VGVSPRRNGWFAEPTQTASAPNILAAAKGWGLLAGGRVFESASRFVIVLMLARVLGVEGYGLYVLALAAGSLFAGIALLGLDEAMVRYIAILSGRRDRSGVWGALQVGLGVSLVAGIGLGAVLYFGAAPIAQRLFDEPRLTELLRLVAVIVPLLVASNMLASVARGFRRMDYVAFAENIVPSVLRIVLVGLVALGGWLNAYSAVALFGLSDLVASTTLIILLNRQFPLRGVFHRDTQRCVRRIFGFALPLWLSGLLSRFRQNLLTMILGSLTSATSVGLFAVAARVNELGHLAMGTITVSIRPLLAQLKDRRDGDALSHLYRIGTRWTISLSLPFFLIIVLFPEQLLRLVGDSFGAGAAALILMAFGELVNAATGICGAMVDMTGHPRIKLVNSAIWTTLLLGGSAALIPRWGVVGAASAVFIATAAVNILVVIEVWLLEGLIPFERSFWKPLTAGLGGFLTGWGLQRVVPVDANLRMAALEAAIVVGVYAVLLLRFRLEPEDRLVVHRVILKCSSLFRSVRGRGRVAVGGPS
jgi:O-antigen/teichoic acid export membrane protein